VSAFTLFGMVFPLAFLVFPVATSRLLEVSSWRLVPLVWVLAGIGMVAVSLIMLDAGERAADVGEWVTPLLAGMAFAAGARAVSELDDIRLDPPLIAWSAVVCAVAAVGCLMAKRRIRQATFTTRPVRGRQLPLLLVAIALVSLSGLLTFVSIALEYLYALSAYEAAIAVVPAQVGAILGARFMARYAIGRWGRVRAARILMLALAAGMLPLLLLRVGTPLWLLVGTATIFSFMWMAVLTVLNAEVMRRAPQGHTGAVSSFRTAASSLGAAVGVGILGTIVISSVPVEAGVAAVTADDLTGLTNSLRLDGLLASLVAVAGWIVLGFVSRRSAPDPAAAGETR
jgi:DHA2 family multidrug resistance protein-like MFS transporter